MTVTHDQVRQAIDDYLLAYPADTGRVGVVRGWLDAGTRVTDRSEMRGHVTAAAVLVNGDGRVLHVHHKLFDGLLIPGGHVEDGDRTLSDTALRELVEEAGLEGAAISLAWPYPIHVDMHEMPARPDKGEGVHNHVDFRYVFRLEKEAEITLQEEEVSGYAWLDADDLYDPELRDRVSVFLSE
jgi:8-oxo-dGTP pyrophosphatase MutT (NUDIX family)